MTCFTATNQASEICATDASVLIETTAGWKTMEKLLVGTQTTKFGSVTTVTQKEQPACSYIFDSIEHGISDRDFAMWCPDFDWDSHTIAGFDGLLQTMRADHTNQDVMHKLLRGSPKMWAAARKVCSTLTACKSEPGNAASKTACIDTKFVGLGKELQAYEASLGLSSAAATIEHALSAIEAILD